VAGTVVTSVVEQQHKVLRSGPTRLKDLATPRQMGRSPDHGEMIYGINIIRKKHNNMCIFLTIYIYNVYIYIFLYTATGSYTIHPVGFRKSLWWFMLARWTSWIYRNPYGKPSELNSSKFANYAPSCYNML
jgi:hypothetical protein